MKPYLISLAAGLLIGLIYSLLGVRSPAPPASALLGLLGMLLGEQAIPAARRVFSGKEVIPFLRSDHAGHVQDLPANQQKDDV